MRVRLVHVTVKRSGARAQREEIVDTDVLSVGRGTDNQLQIPGLTVALHHATFSRQLDGMRIEVREASSLLINGAVRTSATVRPGDTIGVGQHELRVLENGPGDHLALEIEQVVTSASESEEIARRTRIGIEHGLLSRRLLSWSAVILIVGGLLVVPVLGTRARQSVKMPESLAIAATVAETAWSVGRISRNHGAIADRCQSCHAEPFAPVRNPECLSCHADVSAHVPRGISSASAHERCASCHQEHRGDAGLVSFNDRLCVGCHGDLQTVAPGSALGDVRGFATLHPEFRPAVVVDLAADGPERVIMRELLRPGVASASSGAARGERSGLKFTHRKHLAANLRGPDGPLQLGCESCHTAEADGALMRKVSFAAQCQSCHSLAFDPGHPERQAPHTAPPAVRTAIFEYYAARILEERLDTAPGDAPTRRRPGDAMTDRERVAVLALAAQRATDASRALLDESGACAQCHTLHTDADEVRIERVRLMPLRTNDRWLPFATFTHARLEHRRCADCHDAAAAESAEVVIMPSIEACTACHGDEDAASGKVSSTCLTCHEFHQPGLGPMHVADAGSAER